MADNVVADAGAGGSTFAAAELSFSGDTVVVPGSFVGLLSGSEGSWTFSLLVGGAGAVAAGVQRVTLASDDPAVAKLGTIDADTSVLAGAVSGTEMQVDVVAALPAGNNNIGDVDVASIVPGTGATNLGKAIDTATGGTDTGVLALATRDDALSALTPAEGDNVQLRTDANGALWVIPSGTITVAAHAVTNAGTFAVQVDGNALTSLQLIDDVVFADDAAFTLGTSKGVMMMGFAGTQSVDANDAAALACTTAGALHVSVQGTVTVGSHAVTNAGTFAVQVDGSALTALQKIDDPVLVDDAAFTPATSSVMMAGFEADEGSTDSVDEGDAGAARMTLDRKVIVQPQPHTTGGLSIFSSIDLDESEEEVKGTAGQIYGITAFNRTAAPLYLKLYNLTAANTTVGSSTVIATFVIPANADSDGAGFILNLPFGLTFDTAISAAVTTGVAAADTGAPGANDAVVNIFYK